MDNNELDMYDDQDYVEDEYLTDDIINSVGFSLDDVNLINEDTSINLENFVNNFDKDSLKKIKENFGNLKLDGKIIEHFKCSPENRTCEEGYTWTTKYSSPAYGLCNSKCKREKQYTSWSEITGVKDSLSTKKSCGRRCKWSCKSSSCDSDLGTKKDFNSHIDILSDCKPGDGDCPYVAVDCDGYYTKCNKDCKKRFKITKNQEHGGKKCPKSEVICEQGEGDCPLIPVNCSEGYSQCQMINGKCQKKNVIYEQPANGGLECKNKPLVECKEGEGSCPQNCNASWSLCNKNCFKKYTIKNHAKNGGLKCKYEDGEIKKCLPGESGQCELDEDCDAEWSNCDSKCFKTWKVSKESTGRGLCRHKNNFKKKCTKDDEFRCRTIPEDCQGRWGTCDSKCKKRWIKTKEEVGGGKCDYNENIKYDCNEGEGDCEQSIDCYGVWSKCDKNCLREWKVKDEARGISGKCPYKNGTLLRCKKGEGDCGKVEKPPAPAPVPTETESNSDISDKDKKSQMILYLSIGLLLLILGALLME